MAEEAVGRTVYFQFSRVLVPCSIGSCNRGEMAELASIRFDLTLLEARCECQHYQPLHLLHAQTRLMAIGNIMACQKRDRSVLCIRCQF
jgi:hypothetical protein